MSGFLRTVSLASTRSSLTELRPGRVAGLETAVGMAYSGQALRVLHENPELCDYVEVPVEQVARDPEALAIKEHVPIVLHCATLSIASSTDPVADVVDGISRMITETASPWLGEYLAFHREGEWDMGFTISPQFSHEVLDRVTSAVEKWSREQACPLVLENGPIYLDLPGAEMSQVQFIHALFESAPSAFLLLDLSHLLITCRNLSLDPVATLDALPLERVVEVHVSGLREEGGLWWDDHARPVPDEEFELLRRLLGDCRPRAITLEYNWDPRFPTEVLLRDFGRVRELVAAA